MATPLLLPNAARAKMPDRDVGRGHMSKQTGFSAAVSVLALIASAPAWGQSTGANDAAATDVTAEAPQGAEDAIVVTGVRRSLERAADRKSTRLNSSH